MGKVDRKHRVRSKLRGRSDRPRLSVFVSNQHVYAQIIDDKKGQTLVAARDVEVVKEGGKSIDIAKQVGALLAQKAKDKKVMEVVFDRGSFKYHGRVKALAESAREGGLNF